MEKLLGKGCVSYMYKVGVVGDKDSILAFKALGIDVYPAVDPEEARKIVDRMAYEKYGVIFLTEQLAAEMDETIARYNRVPVPAIILIPSNQGTLNIGKHKISDNVEKAVGVNIL